MMVARYATHPGHHVMPVSHGVGAAVLVNLLTLGFGAFTPIVAAVIGTQSVP